MIPFFAKEVIAIIKDSIESLERILVRWVCAASGTGMLAVFFQVVVSNISLFSRNDPI